jgi:hypothetical protein
VEAALNQRAIIGAFFLLQATLFGQNMPLGQECRVNTRLDGYQGLPRILSLSNGDLFICWGGPDRSDYSPGLFGRLFSSDEAMFGSEFGINTHVEGGQENVQMALLLNGNFLICWESGSQDGSEKSIDGQLFSPDGGRLGPEFHIYSSTEDWPSNIQAASLADGGFAVCWENDGYGGLPKGVYVRLFSSDGSAVGPECRMNAHAEDSCSLPRIVPLPDGGFTACWLVGGPDGFLRNAVCRSFLRESQTFSQELRITPQTAAFLQNLRATSLTDGRSLVSWECWGRDGSDWGVYGQLFSADGVRLGQEFQINTVTDGSQIYHQTALLTSGRFVVCWGTLLQGGTWKGGFGQLFSSEGGKIGREFLVSDRPFVFSLLPQIAALSNGGFTVVWGGWNGNRPGRDVFGQLFSPEGDRVHGEFRVNTHVDESQDCPCPAPLPNGDFFVCWMSSSQDGSDNDIYAKRLPNSPRTHTLERFGLLAPSNDSSIRTVDPVLIWRQPSPSIVCYPWELHYTLFVDEDPGFSSPRLAEQDQDTTAALCDLKPGTTYFWKVLAKNLAGDSLWSSTTNAFFVAQDAVSGVEYEKRKNPAEYALYSNYPNPFNAETVIRFDMPSSGNVVISIRDVNGRLVRCLLSESRNAGNYSVSWDGRDGAGRPVPSGIYICRMEAQSGTGQRFGWSVKMGLVR